MFIYMKKIKAFTLVELIVVITILAVLSTIAYTSFQWYSQSARDSTRIANLRLIEKALSIYVTTNSFFPEPSNSQNITINNWWIVNLRKRWTVWESVNRVLKTLSEIPKDPITWDEYWYALTLNRKQYELRWYLESSISNKNTNISYANNEIPRVRWNYNKLFLVWSDKKYYAVPSLFWSWIDVSTQTSFDIDQANITYNVSNFTDNSNNDITTDSFSNEAIYEEFWRAIQDAYSWSQLASNKYYLPYLSATSSDEYSHLAKISLWVIKGEPIISSWWGSGWWWVTCTFDSSTFNNCNFQ